MTHMEIPIRTKNTFEKMSKLSELADHPQKCGIKFVQQCHPEAGHFIEAIKLDGQQIGFISSCYECDHPSDIFLVDTDLESMQELLEPLPFSIHLNYPWKSLEFGWPELDPETMRFSLTLADFPDSEKIGIENVDRVEIIHFRRNTLTEHTAIPKETIATLKAKIRMAEAKIEYKARDWEKFAEVLPKLKEKLAKAQED